MVGGFFSFLYDVFRDFPDSTSLYQHVQKPVVMRGGALSVSAGTGVHSTHL